MDARILHIDDYRRQKTDSSRVADARHGGDVFRFSFPADDRRRLPTWLLAIGGALLFTALMVVLLAR